MQINVSYNTNVNRPLVNVPVNNDTQTTRETRQNNPVVIDMPTNQQTNADDAQSLQMIRYEINQLLQQFSEWLRVATEAKRMDLLYHLLLKESHETSDVFGTIMEIARRIMKGDNVTIEEMRFLSDHNPQLLFVVLMLKDQSTNEDEKERRKVRERRRKDRRAEARKHAQSLRNHKLSDTRGIERMKLSVPNDSSKDKNSFIALTPVKNLYDNIRNIKNKTSSIDELIANPHDIAT